MGIGKKLHAGKSTVRFFDKLSGPINDRTGHSAISVGRRLLRLRQSATPVSIPANLPPGGCDVAI